MKMLFAIFTGALAMYLSVATALCIFVWGKYPHAFTGNPPVAALVMVIVAASAILLAYQASKQ